MRAISICAVWGALVAGCGGGGGGGGGGDVCGDGRCGSTESSGSCCKDCGCPMGEACSAGSCTMMMSGRKSFGAACTADTDCITNLCIGVTGHNGRYCSEACTKSSTCAAESADPEYWCVSGGGSAAFCQRSCNSSADCASIGSDWSCDVSSDVESLLHGVCGIYTALPEGEVCLDSAQCANHDCNGTWCSGACTSNASCGTYAKCVFTNDQSYRCFPNCTTKADCAQFGGTVGCWSVTSRDGSAVNVCANN